MIGYIRAEEAAERWNVSLRHIQRLCIDGRIDGAVKFGNTWAIPENAERVEKQKPGRKPKSKITNNIAGRNGE